MYFFVKKNFHTLTDFMFGISHYLILMYSERYNAQKGNQYESPILTHCILMDSSLWYVGQVYLSFKGCQVYFVLLSSYF